MKKFLFVLLMFSLIFSVGIVSASELNETSYLGDVSDNSLISTDLNQQKIGDEVVELSEDNSCDIYVDAKGDSVTGNGTKENPVTTLDSARDCVKEYKNKITVNIFEGTYTIGSELKFNTSNLHINASGNVIIKNLNDADNIKQSFGLEQSNGNFTMSNVIFDGSGWTRYNAANQFFTPFSNGNDNFVKFDNCTFSGFDAGNTPRDPNFHKTILPHSAASLNINNVYEFTNCKFINYTSKSARGIGNAYKCNVTFENCVFSAEYAEGLGMTNAENVIFDSCWFGYNNFNDNRMFTSKNSATGEIKYRQPMTNGLYKFTRYAIFDMSENYLGDNVYEIVGKLMWNDTTTDNIDKLGPMTVDLSADKGDIQKTAILENGIFKVNYSCESDSHEITAVLGHQIIKLNNSINFTLNSPSIQYGDNQNVTVSFQNNVNGTVFVTVNNKTYRVYLDDKNVTVVSIEDKLSKGTHDIVVKFESDNENYVINLGFNTTTLSVLGIDSSLNASAVTTNYKDTKELVAILTDVDGNVLVNKTVNVIVGTIDKNLTTDDAGQVSVDVSSLVPGSYVATISFMGDELYEESATTANVVVNKVVPDIVITPEGDLVPGEKLIVKVEVPYATENVTIIVNGDKKTTKLVDNAATYTIDELTQGTYYVTVLYAGDELCDFAYATNFFNVVKSTVDLINDLNNTIESQKELIGNLSDTIVAQNSTLESQKVQIGNLTNLVVAQNATIIAQKEQIDNLKKTNGEVVVSKKATKLTAPKKTFKAKTKTKKLKVKLTTGKTVLKNKKVTLKVKGKTYTAKTNKKGIATFKITKLTKKGTFKYTVKFAGDKAYKTTNKKGKIIVK